MLFAIPLALQTLTLALGTPAWVVAVAAFLAGVGIAVHLTLWFTVFQQQIPERAQSRVASYDTLGSFVLMPVGMAIVGPVSDAIGVMTTLWRGRDDVSVVGRDPGAAAVWAIRRSLPEPSASPA